MPTDWNAFRSFAIQSSPGMTRQQLSDLDDFIQMQQATEQQALAAQLVQGGQLGLEQAADPRLMQLASQIISQGGGIPQQPREVSQAERMAAEEMSNIQMAKSLLEQSEAAYGRIGRGINPLGLAGKIGGAFGGETRISDPLSWLNVLPGLEEIGLAPAVSEYRGLIPQVALPYSKLLGGASYPGILREVKTAFPSPGAAPGVAKRKFGRVREILAERERLAKGKPGAARQIGGGGRLPAQTQDPLNLFR